MKLFVYGIFLGESMREGYGMRVIGYDTVRDYITVGGHIVQAKKVDPKMGAALTGLVVEVPETLAYDHKEGEYDNIERLDALETGYDRVIVQTTAGHECWMYCEKERVASER